MSTHINNTNTTKRKQQSNQFQLQYIPKQIQGECIILSIIPLKLNNYKYALFIFLSIITLGILLLLTHWYSELKRKMMYDYVNIEESTHLCIENYDNEIEIVQKLKDHFFDGKQEKEVSFFINRYLKYFINGRNVTAACYQHIKQKISECMSSQAKGWNSNNAIQLTKSYGSGAMIIKKPTAWQIFIKEVLSPLYIFLIFNLILQIQIQYYYFCIVIAVSSIGGIVLTIIQVMKVNDRLFEMAYYEVKLNLLRQGEIRQISSLEIVPGDIVFFNQAIRIPFQAVLLEGEMLINQCVLTGESVPVVKKAEMLQKYLKKETLSKSCYLYQGTTIVQINNKKTMKVWQKYRQRYGVPVCVTRTNFTTLKGQLIRKILFPNQVENTFQRQSNKFLLFLFAITCTSYIFLIFKLRKIVSPFVLLKRGLDLISITVPPTLPISMVIGIIYAVNKLKKKNIFTISPNQIIEGGLLEIMCFDKTGTLTHDHMNFKAFVPTEQKEFKDIIDVATYKQHGKAQGSREKYLANMASNHTVVVMDATLQLIGDPMEIKLLEFSGCKIIDKPQDQSALFAFEGDSTKGQVYQRFDFESSLQRMSVVSTISNGDLYIFTKGSPQMMLSIMKPDSVPLNYQQKLRQFASSGFRILAIGSRKITQWKNKQRGEIQCQLQFNGFQIFQNGLKKETKSAIKQLRQNNINPIMITGDNPITASNIGYQSAILDPNTTTIIVDYNTNKGFFQQEFQYIYEKNNDEKYTFNRPPVKKRCKTLLNSNDSQATVYSDSLIRKLQNGNFNLCLTGTAFNKFFKEMDQGQKLNDFQKDILQNTQILARTKPSDKAKVVKLYQALDKIVGMCGDGANDCDALHQANLGLSLSDTQASIAAAFTAKDRHIGSMVELIKQCRAGLATNFSLFNIMASYALTQFTTCILMQYFFSYPSDFQFVYWDLFLNLIFVFLLGNIDTVPHLTKQSPSASLFSVKNIVQLLAYYFLQLAGQLLVILALNGPFADSIDYFSKGGENINSVKFIDNGGTDFLFDTPENNVLFLVSNFYYLGSVLAFTVTKPWKEQVYTYWPFLVSFLLLLAYSICLTIVPASRLSIFNINFMTSKELNEFILIIGLGVGILVVILEKFVLIPIFKCIQDNKMKEIEENQ